MLSSATQGGEGVAEVGQVGEPGGEGVAEVGQVGAAATGGDAVSAVQVGETGEEEGAEVAVA